MFFTKEHHGFSLIDHPEASKLPQSTGKVTTFPGPRELTSLGLTPETPRNIDDLVFSGKPQFCLHVQTFTDGTLVSLVHSHITCDLVGLASIFEAWSLILAGKSEAVPPMVGYHEDVFAELLQSTKPTQRHVLADKILAGWRFRYWGIRSLLESWWYPSESRTLCIPKRIMEAIVREARSHISGKADATSSSLKPFISEGDVITALACRTLALYQGPGSTRDTAIIMAVDPRSRLKSVFRSDAAYVQNAPTNVFVFCRANKALELPLGQLALLVREAIVAQTTEEQLKATISLSVQTMKDNKLPVVFGSKDMSTQFMSNWTKGNLAERMDFSPAIVQDAVSRPPLTKRGHPLYFQASDPGHNTVSVISSVFVVVGKDYEGNTWYSNSMPTKMWKDLMAYLDQFT